MRQVGIILALFLTWLRLSTSDYSGVSFKLTRVQDDNFTNPTARDCKWTTANQQFCIDANSRCDSDCCSCTCDYQTSTFDRNTMKCRKNYEFRLGCKTRFINTYDRQRIKLLNLSKKGEIKIYWKNEFNGDDVKSLDIDSISWYHNGSEINPHFLTTKGKPKQNENNWEMTIKWDEVPTKYNGEIFRVNTSYQIGRKLQGGKRQIYKKDCFVFKSSGSITVTFPSSTDKSRKPTTPGESSVITKDFSTQTVSSSTKVKPETHETRIPKPPIKVSTTRPVVEPSRHSSEAREGADGGDNTVVILLEVVACLIFLVAVGLLIFWARTRSARTSKDKGFISASTSSPTHLPAMSNPLSDGVAVYENPEVVVCSNRRSGVTSIESAAHDACSVVENPSSVYENIPEPTEPTYKALDPAKREPPTKYQSLIKPRDHETHLPAMSNPQSDDVTVYEYTDVVDSSNHRSGVTSIESAAHDACLGVKNPSSVYENIPEPTEPTPYKALDPAKREPSAKYQSLIKPSDDEHSTLADVVSGAPMQEPLYCEVSSGPSSAPRKNGGPNARSPTHDNNPMPSSQPRREPPSVAELIHIELENSGCQAEGGVKHKENGKATSSPQIPDSPTVADYICIEIERSGRENINDGRPNDLANGLEESNESGGGNGTVDSVLEGKQV